MKKEINPHDVFNLARDTGRSVQDVLTHIQQEGWQISEDAPRQHQVQIKKTSVLGDPKAATELMKQLQKDVLAEAYRIDPLIRQEMDAVAALNSRPKAQPFSNLIRDEHGYLVGVKESVVSGVAATSRNQEELMKAIRQDVFTRYGVSQ